MHAPPGGVIVHIGVDRVVGRQPDLELRPVAEVLAVLEGRPHAVAAGQPFDDGRVEAAGAAALGGQDQAAGFQRGQVEVLGIAVAAGGKGFKVNFRGQRFAAHGCQQRLGEGALAGARRAVDVKQRLFGSLTRQAVAGRHL